MDLVEELVPGLLLVATTSFGDQRGSFTETFNASKMASIGIDTPFVQDNESISLAGGTVRGLHLQLAPHTQGKLVRVLSGSIFDVAVDIRPASPTYLQHGHVTLSGADNRLFWMAPGFAHGFCTLEPNTTVSYKVTAAYAQSADRSILWNDPQLAIDWPVDAGSAVLSDKDRMAPLFSEIENEL